MDIKERVKDQLRLYRRIAQAHLGNKCQRCGATERLTFHHKDKNFQNSDLSNIVLLCTKCHGREHQSPRSQLKPRTSIVRVSLPLIQLLRESLADITAKNPEIRSQKDAINCAVSTLLRQYGVIVESESGGLDSLPKIHNNSAQ